jgi:predicted ATPase
VVARLAVSPVGRDAELTVLREAVAALEAGRGGQVWIEGEPGIGKSTLLAQTLSAAALRHCQVYRAVGDPLGRRQPLRALVDGLGPERAADVVALLHSGDAREQLDGSGAVPAAMERLLSIVDRLCVTAPVLLAFDDLQWADEDSLVTWHRLGLAVGQLPLLLVSTCRPVPVRPAVAQLRRGALNAGAALLSLGPLPEADLAGLVTRQAGRAPGPRLRQLLTHAGGNPLYAGELVDALRREGRIQLDKDRADLVAEPGHGPAGLGAAIRDRLGFLSEDTTGVLRVAALLGPDFSLFDLATVTGRPAATLLAGMDEAVAAGVLAETGDRLDFRHDLIRQALYELTPAGDRVGLHRKVAQVLAHAGMPLDQVAAHLLAAAPDGLDGWATGWLAGHATKLAYRRPGARRRVAAGRGRAQ